MQIRKTDSEGNHVSIETMPQFQSVQDLIDYGVEQSEGESLVVLGDNLEANEPPAAYSLFAYNGVLVVSNIV